MTQRIVGISAHAIQEDVEKGLKIGMDDFRPKPITFKVLSDLIECDKQIEMSRRLDEIEQREALAKNDADDGGNKENPKGSLPKTKHVINGRACTLLMISPRSEEEHTKLMQSVIKNSGLKMQVKERSGKSLAKMVRGSALIPACCKSDNCKLRSSSNDEKCRRMCVSKDILYGEKCKLCSKCESCSKYKSCLKRPDTSANYVKSVNYVRFFRFFRFTYDMAGYIGCCYIALCNS